jgi:hypothetical protein
MVDYVNYKNVKRATDVGGYSTSKEEEEQEQEDEEAIESRNRAMAPIKTKVDCSCQTRNLPVQPSRSLMLFRVFAGNRAFLLANLL